MLKSFTVDIQDEVACQRLINILQSYVGTQRRAKGADTKIDAKRKIFDACVSILNTDISSLYQDLNFSLEEKFYVYAHLDPTKKVAINRDGKSTFAATLGMLSMPFYIGKGIGNRAFELSRNETHRKIRERLKSFGEEAQVCIIKENLSEVDALALESKLIDIFGLVSNKGRLANLDEGIKKDERQELYAKHLRILSNLFRNSV